MLSRRERQRQDEEVIGRVEEREGGVEAGNAEGENG